MSYTIKMYKSNLEVKIPLKEKTYIKQASFGVTTKCLIIIALTFLFLPNAYAFTANCTVTRVIDGDTFHCQPDRATPAKTYKDGTITVRIRGIDAPEKIQAYGEETRDSLKQMIGRKTVRLDVKDVDRYGRVVGYVYINGKNINLEQVKSGYAWAYTDYLDRSYVSAFYES